MSDAVAYTMYVGIDWGSAQPQVEVLDEAGRVQHERVVAHDGEALQAMAQWLVGLGGGRPVAVALEIPHGPVVDVLLERGCHVFALNPRQMDRFRDRYSAAGAKDDRRDGRVLASALRTDPAAFRRLEPDDPAVRQLREWTRIDAEVGTELRRLTSRLREQLLRFYPQALGLCPAGDEPWFWALLQRAPTPAAARRLRPGPVAALLRQHHIRRLTAETVLAALQVTPVHVAPGTVEAATAHIGLLLPRLALLAAQQRTCADQLERGLAGADGSGGTTGAS